ncbi:MAG: hypothetical protein WC461_02310 [Candidatus Paceibacterota bacterium]
MTNLSDTQKTLLIIFFGLIFIYSCNQLKESDAFYHLKTGELIWQMKSVPHFDVFSYTAAGAPWVTHEWLAELIFYFVQAFTGFWGLISFVALISVLTYFIIFRLAMKQGADFYVTLAFLFGLVFTTFKFWIPRPQIFSYLALAILVFSLESFRREKKNKYLWFIAVAMLFWANTNASFLLGIVVVLFYFIAELFKKYLPYFGSLDIEGKDFKKFGLAALAAVAVCFINPNTYHSFLYPLYVRFSVDVLKVEEWRSVLNFWQDAQTGFFLALIAVADIFLIWRLFFKKSERDIVWLGVVLGISILPFISFRHCIFWPIAAVVPLSVAVSKELKGFFGKINYKRLPIFALAVILILMGTRYISFPRENINKYTLPVGASDFIEKNNLKGPFFNLYNEGGYLIWRFWPKEKVFIDGRSEVFGKDQLLEFFTIVKDYPDWDKVVNEKYKINYFILAYRPDDLSKSIFPLILKLVRENWALVYWDDAGLIFLKNSPENMALIKKYGFSYINPFYEPSKITGDEVRPAMEEIKRLLMQSPDSFFAKSYAEEFLSTHKQ